MPEPRLNKVQNVTQQIAAVALATLLTTASASADDLEIYQTADIKPKVLFVLDTSGSMDELDDDGDPTTPAGTKTRLRRMQDAMNSLLGKLQGVDVGIMRYSHSRAQLIHPVVDAESNQLTLSNAVESLDHDGATPTVAALYEAQRYLTGQAPYRGTVPGGNATYTKPATNECQSNHIVLLSDGEPSSDRGVVRELTGRNSMLTSCTRQPGNRGNCGAELTRHMGSEDQFPDFPGVDNPTDPNTISTHTIGFNVSTTWLEDLAFSSDGDHVYEEAESTDDLINVFEKILRDKVLLAANAAAPAVSANAFNQNRHRDELYYSLFQPSLTTRWAGNIKKYRIKDGDIVDANDDPVIVANSIAPTSVSLWSKDDLGNLVSDGLKVTDGGMAHRQPQNRNWYTDEAVTADADGHIVPRLAALTNGDWDVSELAFGPLVTPDERNDLVAWVRGTDSIDSDNNNITNEPNRYVADSIHSSPVLVSYKAKAATATDPAELEEVLYTANNMGVLHAVDPETGNEIWSYTPKELLPNIKAYVDNDSSSHVYGLDGELFVHNTYKANTTYDYEIDKSRLYLTQRRGGSNLIALDVSNALSDTDPPVTRLWSINNNSAGFQNMAQTWSKPQLIPIRTDCPANCKIREVLMFSGGYSTLYDDTSLTYPVTAPATGHGNAIYLVDPDTGALLWSAGKGTHHDLQLDMQDSVPTTPVPVDTDADGVANTLFFSDIGGNVWRIDMNTAPTTTADFGSYADDFAIDGGKIAALNEAGQSLRFFTRPDISISGGTIGASTFYIALGSGMRSSPTFTEPNNNRFFVLKDSWVFDNPTAFNQSTNTTETNYEYVRDSFGARTVITPSVLWEYGQTGGTGPTEYGYFHSLPAGEKVLEPTLTHQGRVFLITYVPHDPSTTTNPCEYSIGESRLYILDTKTGEHNLQSTAGIDYEVIGVGIVAGGALIDTGGAEGVNLLAGMGSSTVAELLAPNDPTIFRRFHRTGWSELEY